MKGITTIGAIVIAISIVPPAEEKNAPGKRRPNIYCELAHLMCFLSYFYSYWWLKVEG